MEPLTQPPPHAYDTLALSGTDGALGPGLGPGRVFRALSSPALNNSGEFVFGGVLVDPTQNFENDFGLWKHKQGTNQVIVREGDAGVLGPGLAPEKVFEVVASGRINDAGQIAFAGILQGPGLSNTGPTGLWRHSDGVLTPFALESVEGLLGPNLEPNTTFDRIVSIGRPAFNSQGVAAFQVNLLGPSATTRRSRGLWKNAGVGANQPIARGGVTGALGPNLGGAKQFDSFGVLGGPNLLNNGDMVFSANLAIGSGGVVPENSQGVWRNIAGQNRVIARSGTSGPLGPNLGEGMVFALVNSMASANSEGLAAFSATVTGDGVNSRNEHGIWSSLDQSNRLIARSGSSSEHGPGLGPDAAFTNFNWTGVAANGDIHFRANINISNDSQIGLWRHVDGNNVPVALTGQDGMFGPGLGPDVAFRFLHPAESNAHGDMLFYARLAGSGITTNNDAGLWKFTQGHMVLLAREGDEFDVDPSPAEDFRTIVQIIHPSIHGGALPSGGSDGRLRSLNDRGSASFYLRFSDGSSGAFVASPVPEPSSLAMLVTVLFCARLRRKTR